MEKWVFIGVYFLVIVVNVLLEFFLNEYICIDSLFGGFFIYVWVKSLVFFEMLIYLKINYNILIFVCICNKEKKYRICMLFVYYIFVFGMYELLKFLMGKI